MTMPLLPPIGNPPGFEEPREAPRAAPAAPATPAPTPAAPPAPAPGPLPSPDGRHHVVAPARVVPWAADAPAETNADLPAPKPVAATQPTVGHAQAAAAQQPAASASETPAASASKPTRTSKRRGVGLPALIGIGVVGLVLGAGAVYGIQSMNQPSALAAIPERCALAEGSYDLSDTELVLHAPAAVSDAGRFAGDGACVLYELDAAPEGQTFVDYLATLEEPATIGGFTVQLDPESGELKVTQS